MDAARGTAGLAAGPTACRRPVADAGTLVLLLAIAGAMAAEPWAGTRSRSTVNATSSAAGDDGFAKSAMQTLATLNNAKVVRGEPR